MRASLRRFLTWAVLLAVLLPVALVVVVGLGALLSALGDKAGAVACWRVCLVGGVGWFVALAGTATAAGILALEGPPRRGGRHGERVDHAEPESTQR